jgi:hypothetical protein
MIMVTLRVAFKPVIEEYDGTNVSNTMVVQEPAFETTPGAYVISSNTTNRNLSKANDEVDVDEDKSFEESNNDAGKAMLSREDACIPFY